MKVLVVDDEQPIVDAVCYNLRKEGYEALAAGNAEQCMDIAYRERPDLVLLDVMLPSASGFDLCRMLRKRGDTPIIMLTAKADETDRVVGFELGADDYVTKPFSMRELMARVKSVLRRSSAKSPDQPQERVHVNGMEIDPIRHEARVDGHMVALSPREFELLYFMARHPGQVFSRTRLLEHVWGVDSCVEDRTVDVHIRWLREKVERNPSFPDRIQTVRGVGYKVAEG